MLSAEIGTSPAGGIPTVSVGGGSPVLVVTVREDGRACLQVAVHSEFAPQGSPFTEAIVWDGWMAIGHGQWLNLVGIASREATSLPMALYFGSLTVGPGYLLAASASNLLRIEPDGSVLWTSDEVGIDGVVVASADDARIEGEGEWDPPGGWRPFAIDARTGKLL